MNSQEKPGLYLHIPFCRSKCSYCGFYSIASTSLLHRWLDALKKEMTLYRDRFGSFDSIYVGGGTPSLLDTRDLTTIIDYIFANFSFSHDIEITIEANPCDLTRGKISELKNLGFNRVSVGVQSFNDRILSFLGRKHSADDSERAFTLLRENGFENIGMDLIYGFKGMSMDHWSDTLYRCLTFQPEHVSCYQLTFERHTLFNRFKQKGLITPLSEDEECSYFMATSRVLSDNGYIHYEISNFARDEIYTSRHNRKYWHHIPYLGLGPSAHSFQGSNRWWNVRSIRNYCDALESGRAPIEGCENLTHQQLRLESISLGARTREGIDLEAISHDLQSTQRLTGLQDAGFLHVENGRVVPTTKGFLVADHLPLYLFD